MKNQYVLGGLGARLKRSAYFALTSGRSSPAGSSVMKSSWLLMTSCVIFGTVSLTTVILSTFGAGVLSVGTKFGFFVSVNWRVGFWIEIWNGPAPGIEPSLVALSGDFAAGVGAPLTSAIAKRNFVSAFVSLTVISPVWSLLVMPEMSPFIDLPLVKVSIPTISSVKEENGPPSRCRRFSVFSKSLALTGVPSEYLMPGRSLKV